MTEEERKRIIISGQWAMQRISKREREEILNDHIKAEVMLREAYEGKWEIYDELI